MKLFVALAPTPPRACPSGLTEGSTVVEVRFQMRAVQLMFGVSSGRIVFQRRYVGKPVHHGPNWRVVTKIQGQAVPASGPRHLVRFKTD